VPAGTVLVLLGPNGAGKTTLLKILATLVRPRAGHLSIAGVDALREPERVRPLIGMVGHGAQVYEDLTALENLRFWTTLAGQSLPASALRAALEAVELGGVADERVRTFSAGMKRRLALARVQLGGARLLLLDEPFTGLDRQGRKWLGGVLLGVKAAGGVAVIATHTFGTELAAADRVAVMAAGRLVLDRPLAELSWEAIPALYDSLTGGTA